MISKPRITALSCIVLLSGSTVSGCLHAQAPNQWIVPAGFQVTVFADSVQNAREMTLGPRGTVFVGTLMAGKVYAVIDRNGRPDGLRTAGPRTLIQAEGQGRFTELTISGDRAFVRVVKDSLPGASGVTLVGDAVFVLVSRLKAVVVPYRRSTGP